jgi:hypothetical protein
MKIFIIHISDEKLSEFEKESRENVIKVNNIIRKFSTKKIIKTKKLSQSKFAPAIKTCNEHYISTGTNIYNINFTNNFNGNSLINGLSPQPSDKYFFMNKNENLMKNILTMIEI